MTRPQIIRADTIDLQNSDTPSAKDHTRQPAHPPPLGDGPPAPHQAIALKNAEGQEHHGRSPRVSQDLSGKELQLLQDGSVTGEESEGDEGPGDSSLLQGEGTEADGGELAEGEGDDGLDDDMMDRISSSPSIGSGGYTPSFLWPTREDSLSTTSTPESKSDKFPSDDLASSSPFLSSPLHLPLFYSPRKPGELLSEEHHHQGGYTMYETNGSSQNGVDRSGEHCPSPKSLVAEGPSSFPGALRKDLRIVTESYDADFEKGALENLLLPEDDSLLENALSDCTIPSDPYDSYSPASSSSWEDQEPNKADDYDDTENVSFLKDSRYSDSGWGGECLREVEDIDFEFVYALHTFVATVEGQANAAKGDTMVLLDDSNSYWWLVRIVKDSSIGYLPAEHIETPTERLARLNKHKNMDRTGNMLEYATAKSKNPLKKAMRRRNAKTVTFAAPTYYEASDLDYSTDEEGLDGEYPDGADGPEADAQDGNDEREQTAIVEPLKPKGQATDRDMDDEKQPDPKPQRLDPDETLAASQVEKPRSSNEIFDRQDDGSSGKPRKLLSRNNTDSFLKDDGIETRKINLTPSLLREDSSSSTVVVASDSKETRRNPSLEVEDNTASSDRSKDDKKRKEKKPGMLSGLFKRRDRKSKSQADDGEDPQWLSDETIRRSPQPKESQESLSRESSVSKQGGSGGSRSPQRQSSKLQKAPPPNKASGSAKSSPTSTFSKDDTVLQQSDMTDSPTSMLPSADPAPPVTESESTRELREPMFEKPNITFPQQKRTMSSVYSQDEIIQEAPRDAIDNQSRSKMFSPVRDVLRSTPATLTEPKPEKVKKAKQRVAMDDFDSSPEAEKPPLSWQNDRIESKPVTDNIPKERLSESPVQVNPSDVRTPVTNEEPASTGEVPISPVSPSSTPELVEAPHEDHAQDQGTPASTAQSSTTTPTWSDASLRTYLEDDSDIRDLLVVVHDKSDVKPAGPDHPIVGNMFKEENKRLGDMSNRLDGLLSDLLARKATVPAR